MFFLFVRFTSYRISRTAERTGNVGVIPVVLKTLYVFHIYKCILKISCADFKAYT